ncbi:hypothetical protein RF11_04899 [Thelohanellus kitauei]|uniref:Uncharacterized protein n=1 Tax=Thelohanellus kitauei TaxID=669202 RepID=A0A0C2J2J0_THEKT|nr:hypothetical protein RF11_04899 [Thelohanellus kitauei]
MGYAERFMMNVFYMLICQIIVNFGLIVSPYTNDYPRDFNCYRIINFNRESFISFRFKNTLLVLPKRLYMNITLKIQERHSNKSADFYRVQYDLEIRNCTKVLSMMISTQKYLYHDIDISIDVRVHKGFPILTQYDFVVSSETSGSFQKINDIYFVASLFVHFNPCGKYTIFDPPRNIIVKPFEIKNTLNQGSRCVFATFMNVKLVIKYNLKEPIPLILHPSVLVRFEVFDLFDPSFSLIMNLSLGDLRSKILYDNNRNDLSIHLTIIDSVTKYQELAIIYIISDTHFYQAKGSIYETNIRFIPYHDYIQLNMWDKSIARFFIVPLLPLTKSIEDCDLKWRNSQLITYSYGSSKIISFVIAQLYIGTSKDVMVLTRLSDQNIEECEKRLAK